VITSAKNIIVSETESRAFSPGTLAYYRARFRNRLYHLVLSKFRAAVAEEGLTRAELARRTGKRPEVLTRILGAPGNWRLDTVSDLLMGIAGEELDATSSSPFAGAARNFGYPDFYPPIAPEGESNPRNVPKEPESKPPHLSLLDAYGRGSQLQQGQ
jgi:hypothetical protein